MNRTDRLFLENQVNQLDIMQRSILNMRSVLSRRIRRLETQSITHPPNPPRRQQRPNNQTPINLLNEFNLVHREEQTRPQPQAPPQAPKIKIKVKSKSLSKEEFESMNPDVCGICLDYHAKSNSLLCNCNHLFGKDCIKKWKNICNKQKKDLSCPSCREKITQQTKYLLKAPKKITKKQEQALVEMMPTQGIPNMINV